MLKKIQRKKCIIINNKMHNKDDVKVHFLDWTKRPFGDLGHKNPDYKYLLLFFIIL
jgi:hypothetical protein